MDPKFKKTLVIYSLVTVSVILVGILSQISILVVKKPASTENPKMSYKKSGELNSHPVGFGIKVVKKGNYVFEVADGNKLTRKNIDAQPFKLNPVSLTLNNQKTVAKIASDTKKCVYGTNEELLEGSVYSYDCPTFTQASYSNYKTRQNEFQNSFYNLEQTKPYRNGVIGIKKLGDLGEQVEDTKILSLVYVDQKGSSSLTLKDFAYTNEQEMRLAVSGDKIYVIDRKNNNIAYFDGFSDNKQPTLYTTSIPSDNYILVEATAFDSSIYLYSVKKPSGLSDEFASEGATEALLTYFDTKAENQINEIEIKDSQTLKNLGNFKTIEKNKIISSSTENGGSATIYRLSKNKLQTLDTTTNVTDFQIVDGQIYLLSSDNKVFYYNEKLKQAELVFGSEYSKIFSINSIKNNLVLKGAVEQGDSSADLTFLLTNSESTEKKRIQDILPYKYFEDGIPVMLIDYFNDQIIVTTTPMLLRNNNPAEIKKLYTQYLNSSGVELNQFKVSVE